MTGRIKRQDRSNNRRLDLFLQNMQIEEEKRKQIVSYVEELALNILQDKKEPQLRLKK